MELIPEAHIIQTEEVSIEYDRRPVSPTTRAPNYTLRNFDQTGNEALDNALRKLNFKPQNYFVERKNKAVLFLLGTNPVGIKILIRLDQPGLVNVADRGVLELEAVKTNSSTIPSDLARIGGLVNGIAQIDDAGHLCYFTPTTSQMWTIWPVEQRFIQSEIPWFVIPYTTFIRNPEVTNNNLIKANDKIISAKLDQLQTEIEQNTKRINNDLRTLIKLKQIASESIDNLSLSLLILYIYRASHDQDYREQFSSEINLAKSITRWDQLEGNAGAKLKHAAETALGVQVDAPYKIDAFHKLENNIRLRLTKINELLVDGNQIIHQLERLNLEPVVELQQNISTLGLNAFNLMED